MNTIWFDMDGTIYDLYKVHNWLERLRTKDSSVFMEEKPRRNYQRINAAIEALQEQGWQVGVITWAPKNVRYEDRFYLQVADAKFNWLKKFFPALVDGKFMCCEYGMDKAHYMEARGCAGFKNYLVDDNKEVREMWREHGEGYKTINASRSFVRELESLVG